MKNQLRAVCPACFATQAVRGGRLVQHGYRRPQHWHANVGTCAGTGAQHFGTEAGRDFAAGLAVRLMESADVLDVDADEVNAGTGKVFERQRVARGVVQDVVVENPTAHQRRAYAATLKGRARMQRASALEFEAVVAAWKPVEPIVVAVEKTPTTVHLRANLYRQGGGHHACAASAMGARTSYTKTLTDNASGVTCDRCKKTRAFAVALTSA
jgi:hypothetical protein